MVFPSSKSSRRWIPLAGLAIACIAGLGVSRARSASLAPATPEPTSTAKAPVSGDDAAGGGRRSVVFQPPTDHGLSILTHACSMAADVEVVGTRSFVDAAPQGRHNMLYTRAHVRVLEPLFGAPPSEFDVDYPGGTLNGRWVRYSTAPDLAEGDRLILFVGKFGGHVAPCSGIVGAITYSAPSAGLSVPESMLDQLKARIRVALNAASQER